VIERSRVTDAASRTLEWLTGQARWRADTATPVDTLAALLGLEIATFDAALHPGVWGYLEPGEDLIFLRAGLPEAARRFTLAHEIGHVALHRARGAVGDIAGMARPQVSGDDAPMDLCRGSDVETFDLVSDETLNPGQAYRAHAEVEQEANAFAVALLMPESGFLATYLALRVQPARPSALRHTARALARRFAVSEDAALRRLHSLLALADEERETQGVRLFSGATDPQQQAAARLATPALVMAGPGSGKTATLVERAVYLLAEQGARPEEILALTFSRKATRELRGRIKAALAARGETMTPTVSTIHGFCLDLLGRYGALVGLPVEFRLAADIETYFLVRQVMREEPLRRLAPSYAPDLHVRDAQQAISRAKDDLLAVQDVARDAAEALEGASDEADRDAAEVMNDIATVFDGYQRELTARGLVDYGDAIALCVRLLDEQPDVAQEVALRWPHVLLDEYQDINRAMGALIERLVAAGCGLWAVGDADQAIYRFRGADPGIVSRFSATFPGASVASLVRNYRSQRTILDAASAFADAFSQMDDRLALEPARTAADADRDVLATDARLLIAETGDDEIGALARAIEQRRQAGRAYRDQVVLVRTRRQVETLVDGLRAQGVPVSMSSGVLEREDARRALAIVNLLGDLTGSGLIRAGRAPEYSFARADAIVALEYVHRRKSDLATTLRAPGAIPGVSRAGRTGLRQLGRALAALQAAPSVAMGLSQFVFSYTDIGERALVRRADEAGAALALRRLLDIARAFDAQRRLTDADVNRADWPGFVDFLGAVRLLRLDGVESDLAGEADAARVMTVHASKGLEFPVVYLPHMVNRRFPLTGRAASPGRAGQLSRTAGESESEGELSEEAALFYVAMTRARDELVFSRARRYGRQSYLASPFLAPVERALGERLVIEQAPALAAPASEPALAADDERMAPAAAPGDGAAHVDDVFEIGEIEAYQRCPRQYAYRFVDGLWSPTPLSALFGRATAHAARDLELAFSQSYERGAAPPSREEAWSMVESRWLDAASGERGVGQPVAGDRPSLAGYYARQARTTIEAYRDILVRLGPAARELGSHSAEVKARHVTVDLGGIRVRGVVDTNAPRPRRAARQPGASGEQGGVATRAWVRRSETRPVLRDLFAELAALSLEPGERLARDIGSQMEGASPANISARQRERLLREAIEAGAGIRRRDFRPMPDEWKCRRCPFAAACPD
jgi:DNA helicase II / ATP-dependent DNA helicase PcrA